MMTVAELIWKGTKPSCHQIHWEVLHIASGQWPNTPCQFSQLSHIHLLIILANILTQQPTEQFCLYCSNTYGGDCMYVYIYIYIYIYETQTQFHKHLQDSFINCKTFTILIIRIAATCIYPVQPVCISLLYILVHFTIYQVPVYCFAHLICFALLFYCTFYSLFLFFFYLYLYICSCVVTFI